MTPKLPPLGSGQEDRSLPCFQVSNWCCWEPIQLHVEVGKTNKDGTMEYRAKYWMRGDAVPSEKTSDKLICGRRIFFFIYNKLTDQIVCSERKHNIIKYKRGWVNLQIFISQKCKKYKKNTFSIYTRVKIVTVQYLLSQDECLSLKRGKEKIKTSVCVKISVFTKTLKTPKIFHNKSKKQI